VLNNQSQVRPTLEIPPNDYEQDNEESKTILDNNVSLGRNNLKLNLQSQRMENTGGMNDKWALRYRLNACHKEATFKLTINWLLNALTPRRQEERLNSEDWNRLGKAIT